MRRQQEFIVDNDAKHGVGADDHGCSDADHGAGDATGFSGGEGRSFERGSASECRECGWVDVGGFAPGQHAVPDRSGDEHRDRDD
jgi:hypothetical protein